jgi:hypothetical protein
MLGTILMVNCNSKTISDAVASPPATPKTILDAGKLVKQRTLASQRTGRRPTGLNGCGVNWCAKGRYQGSVVSVQRFPAFIQYPRCSLRRWIAINQHCNRIEVKQKFGIRLLRDIINYRDARVLHQVLIFTCQPSVQVCFVRVSDRTTSSVLRSNVRATPASVMYSMLRFVGC